MPALWEENIEVLDATEVNWGTSTILAIFFAASLVSAVFFGLGYSFGRGGTPKPVDMGLTATNTSATGSGLSRVMDSPDGAVSTTSAQRTTVVRAGESVNSTGPVLTQISATRGNQGLRVKSTKPVAVKASQKPAVSERDAAHYMVQVGAIGNRKDARTLVSHLREKGLHAGIYSSKRDKFLHVQIGPFATTEQAQTMRHHVIASGYRAILKHSS